MKMLDINEEDKSQIDWSRVKKDLKSQFDFLKKDFEIILDDYNQT